VPFAIQLIPGGLFMLGSLFLVESPRWLIQSGQREKGIAGLSKLRGLDLNHVYLQEELAQIDHGIELQRSSIGMGFTAPFKAVYRNKKVMYRFLLGGALFFWQNGSGINAINYYSPTVFKSIGITGASTSLLTTGIFGVIKTVCLFIWAMFLIDQLGRRRLLMWGALGGSLSLWAVGGYIAGAKPQEHPSSKLTSGGIAAIVFFYFYTACYAPSWIATPWIVNSEMFDQNVRTLAQAFAAGNNWFWNFMVTRFTPQMFATMGAGVWFFFATMQLLAIPFVYFLLPETRSVPLERMDQLFDTSLKPWRAHTVVMANLQAMDHEFRAKTGFDADRGTEEHNRERFDITRGEPSQPSFSSAWVS
jgi:sugar porter (SP) family MFS transporter